MKNDDAMMLEIDDDDVIMMRLCRLSIDLQ